MDTKAELFDQIEGQVAKLHSYDTFLLQQIPIKSVSKDAALWLQRELQQ